MRNKKKIKGLLLKQLVLILFISCAAVMSPPGGPKDETPPELIETFPPDGTTHFEGGRVELLFSEYLDENTVDRAIAILPSLKEKPDITYSGKKVYIDFPDSLFMNQTYIISINRDLGDEHRVKLSQGIQVAFSTGPQIDQGAISGTVQYSKDASLNLWKIQNELDQIKFYERVPDYVIDASSEGHYEFKFLSLGEYRIAAVDRTLSGTPIVSDRFAYGLSWLPIIGLGSDENVEGVNIQIPDRLGGIRMISAESFQESWGRVSFSESIKDVINEIQLEITDDDSSMVNADFFEDPKDNEKLYFLLDDPMNGYISIKSKTLNKWNTTLVDSGSIRVKMESNIDTVALSIVQPNAKYQLHIESDHIRPLKIIFSNLVELDQYENLFSMLKDSVLIPYTINWDSPISLNLAPKENWEPRSTYNLKISRDEITPAFGMALKDSITSIAFKTSDYQGFGSLIINSHHNSNSSIIAELIKMEKAYPVFRSVVNSEGSTTMNNVPEGNYSLMFFQDSDSNMQYSHGRIDPYRTAEWFYHYPDTVKIRTNWDIELQEIDLNPIQ